MAPDMNPIENLWVILTELVYREDFKPSPLTQKRRILKIRRQLDTEILQNLEWDMPKRMQEVVAAGGKAIHR